MFARLQTFRTAPFPGAPSSTALDVLDGVADRPGFAGGWVLPPIAAPDGALLTLWQARGDGADAGALYRVEDDVPGPDVDDEAAYAQLVHFDGPRTAEWSAAVLRADRERITPALRDTPGRVRTLVLVADDNAHLVVTLTTDVTSLELAQQRIMTTELLPWEEPALLTGPDRIDLHRVAADRRAAPAVTA